LSSVNQSHRNVSVMRFNSLFTSKDDGFLTEPSCSAITGILADPSRNSVILNG
jgi:hypothetical protein